MRCPWRIPMLLSAGLLAVSLGACGRATQDMADKAIADAPHGVIGDVDGGAILMEHGTLVLQARGQPDAHIAADGGFDIGGRMVAVDAAQRAQLANYYRQAQGIVQSGIAVGKAGAALAGSVVGDVLGNLFTGHEDRIDAQARQQADGVKARAAVLCGQLADLRATQDGIAASLPPFRPYATIRPDAAQHCRDGLHGHY